MAQKPKLECVFVRKNISNQEMEYDKSSKSRPAWVALESRIGGAKFVAVEAGKRLHYYFEYAPVGLYLPVDYTKEEMRRYYDKFSSIYDKQIRKTRQNMRAIEYTVGLLDKIADKSSKILDIGSGTGLGAEALLDNSFKDVTMLDFSKGMIEKAKKKPKLKDCKFVVEDFLKYDPKEKFDIIVSFFSFGSPSYFSEEETKKGLRKVKQILNKEGLVAVHGNISLKLFEQVFKPVFYGEYAINKRKKQHTTYFIGKN